MNNKVGFIVMGVSGCGKSTLGQQLAAQLNCEFIEGDDFHPTENIEKMSSGIALTDDDRRPWLNLLNQQANLHWQKNEVWVMSCSALKPVYRDVFRRLNNPTMFIHLALPETVLSQRLAQRQGHFMPPALLASQFETLNFQKAENDIITLDGTKTTNNQISELKTNPRFRSTGITL